MRLRRSEVKALLEALERAERYKPFQVAKRMVMARYGLQGSRVDRLATALLYKIYRLQGILDMIVEAETGLRPTRLPAFLRQALRLAAYLALYDEAGDEELARQLVEAASAMAGKRFRPGDAEAVARLYRVLRARGWRPRSSEERLAAELLLPPLLIQRLRGLLGGMEELRRFAEAVNNPRPVHGLRVNTLKATVEQVLRALEEAGVEAWPSTRVANHVRYRGPLPYSSFRPLQEGWVVPQDESSAAAAPLLAPRPGELVADLCAAPGGKTTHLAELQRNQGTVVALEIFPDRMARLLELARRTSTYSSINPVIGDARRAPALLQRPPDKLLLDPPCSSTGAIAKHPEARWRLTEDMLRKLAERQYEMLRAATRALRPGGRLLYTVCSVLPEEGEHLIQRLLEEEKNLELIPLRGPYDPSPLLPGTMRAWPHRHQTTGFFYALLEKRG